MDGWMDQKVDWLSLTAGRNSLSTGNAKVISVVIKPQGNETRWASFNTLRNTRKFLRAADTQTRNSKVEGIGGHPSKSELIILRTGIG